MPGLADFTQPVGIANGVSLQLSGLTASQILASDASKNLVSLTVATYPSLAELAFMKGATSAIQTQLGTKAKVTTGSYSGDSTTNRAIAHGLAVIPKFIIIQQTNVELLWNNLLPSGVLFGFAVGGYFTKTMTAADATNFYVGNVADYTQSANSSASSRAYTWVAFG